MKTYQYQHSEGRITDKQFSSDATALRFLEEIGPKWQLVTPICDAVCLPPVGDPSLEYDDEVRINYAADVKLDGMKIGSTHCINIAGPGQGEMIRWFGKNANNTASGQAHNHVMMAVLDVIGWHEQDERSNG
ncbi:hypothetical protein [Hymenobacter sp. YC55]|uniref:hypothetical protein n=1 Tax=Hymenobacter sp. YC55 TaxID=3034019 RepID=UPI0023F89BA7|nr:hypothetical protein [Hymenobacter sp. YC55]MDF7810727.1 hypothetical protein [Hymenobacter sp. YC55]